VVVASVVTLAVVALFGLDGCGDFDNSSCQDSWYSVNRIGVVVSLSVPDTIATTDPLQVDLVVLVEPGTYAQYGYTQVHRESQHVTITPILDVLAYSGSCDPPAAGGPYEEHVHEQLNPLFEEGTFEVRVRQPADSLLVRVVQVVAPNDEGRVARTD